MSINVPVERVRELVEQEYGLPIDGALLELTHGVHSRAWLLASNNGRWVAKVSDPASDPETKLGAQFALYAFLNAHTINVPVVLTNRHGHFLSHIQFAGRRYPLTLMRFHELKSLANYILELAGEEASQHGAAAIKRTYELAAYLVNKNDTAT